MQITAQANNCHVFINYALYVGVGGGGTPKLENSDVVIDNRRVTVIRGFLLVFRY